jgi:hypothetical protein
MAPVVPIIGAIAGAATAGSLATAAVPFFAFGAGGGIATALGITAGTASLITAGLAGFVVSTSLNAVGSRLFSANAPSADFTQQAQSRAVMVKSAVDTHKIIYGRAKVSGPLVYAATTNAGPVKEGVTVNGTNLFIHVVVALAGHEIDGVDTVYFNDQPVTLDGDGWVTNVPYAYNYSGGYLRPTIDRTIATATRTTEVVTVTTTVDHGYTAGDKAVTAGQSDFSLNGGFIIASTPSSTTFTYANGGPNTSSTGGTASDQTIADPLDSLARVKIFTGSPTQAASADMIAEVPGWTAAHQLKGVAYLYVRLQYDANVFAQGIPNISAVVRGKKVYDPRDSSTSFSDNAALCIRDYLVSDYGFNCATDELNDTYFTAAANHCDENVTLTTGGTQARYTANGVLDTATAPVDNLNALVAATAGAVTYVQGQFRCYAGVFDSTAGDLTTSMLAGPVKIHTRTARQDLFNAVQGTYVAPNQGYQPTDFPVVADPTYQAQDGGQRIFKDIQLPLTDHPEAAQRIAKVILEQGRQGITVELTLNHAALPYAVWDTVTYTDPVLGWDHKVFRVRKLTTPGIGPVTLSLQEESSASYDWNAGMATVVDAAPDTNLPNPFLVSPPTALDVTESLYVTRDGAGVKSKATLSWLASQDVFLYQYQPEYQLTTDAAWTVLPRTDATTTDALDIAPGLYNFRVKAINSLGVASDYTATLKQISGLSAPPTEPQNLYWSSIGGLAYLNWDPSPDLDVRIGGTYAFRYSPTPTDGWVSSTTLGNPVSGSLSHVVLPLKPGVYLAKAIDSSGIESTTAAGVVVTQDTITSLSTVATLTEDPTFGGTKTNCQVASSKLTLTSTAAAGVYLFHAKMDLGTVQAVRLTAHLRATVVNTTDLIDSRTGLIDDWASIDGNVAASADAVVYVRTTQTDPAGSPTWTAWNRLDSAEFMARGFDFKAVLTSVDPAYNIEISELHVTAAQ